ncbi:hypothetical protein IMSAGC008_00179 [Muribaculaceae bacterium]|nr:hypothetical protein IMSAGC008_00179 [Muribaculaceae bacterium]
MTAIVQFSRNLSPESVNTLNQYIVEVISYEGDSEVLYIDASSEAEALNTAVALSNNADYAMIQAII